MCIAVFLWKAHPIYPFLLLHNRDEYHSRASRGLEWWEEEEEEEGVKIVGGRDEVGGGTWLAATSNSRIAFLTNVRELDKLSNPKSRGLLPLRFLKSNKSRQEFGDELREEAELMYNGFNLIVSDVDSMVYITNRPKNEGVSVTRVSPGVHVLSNAMLDTPWPKAQRLQKSFRNVLDKCSGGEVPIKEMAETIMRDTTKDTDETNLPHIYSPEFEYDLSSIFVEAETHMGRYGTRSTSALSVKADGEVRFYERCLEDGVWKEREITYYLPARCREIVE